MRIGRDVEKGARDRPARAFVREADFAVLLRKAFLRPRIMKGRALEAPSPTERRKHHG